MTAPTQPYHRVWMILSCSHCPTSIPVQLRATDVRPTHRCRTDGKIREFNQERHKDA